MFFCDECASKNNYPESFVKSQGNCEICQRFSVCNDIPSSKLINKIIANQKEY